MCVVFLAERRLDKRVDGEMTGGGGQAGFLPGDSRPGMKVAFIHSCHLSFPGPQNDEWGSALGSGMTPLRCPLASGRWHTVPL